MHCGGRAVRSRARHHECDRGRRVRRHPRDASRVSRRRSRSSRVTKIRPRADPTPTGTRSHVPAARSSSSWARAASREIAKALIAGGRADDTPVAAVRWGTRPEQRTIRATLAARSRRRASRRRARSSSATSRGSISVGSSSAPLFGRTIVVTRAREQASELRARLESLGAEVVELPAIVIEPVAFAVPDLGRLRAGSCSRRPTASTRSSSGGWPRRAWMRARSAQ